MIRYAIEMESGGYMKEEFYKTLEMVKVRTVDLPIDATLLKERSVADRALQEILSGSTNLPVFYDEDNLPKRVVKLDINFKEAD